MKLHYQQIGKGPHVILIHGLFGSLDNLNIIAKSLKDNFTVTSVDLPNHGNSPSLDQMNYPQMSSALIKLLIDLNIEKAILIGHSMGGKVAMQTALTNPSKVSKLIVLDIAPVIYQRADDHVLETLSKLSNKKISGRKEADLLLSEKIEIVQIRQFLLKSLVKNEQDYIWKFNIDKIENNYENILEAPTGEPFMGETLFIKGDRSDYLNESMRDEILKLFPSYKIKLIHSAGHWVHGEKPESVNRAIKRFIQ